MHNKLHNDPKKGYKKTKLGQIPEEWKVSKLSDLSITISSGSTPLRSVKDFYDKGNINWLKTTDLNNGQIYQTEEKVTELALEKTGLKIFPKNTVLVAMYGGFNQIGRTGILKIESAINQAISAIQVDYQKIDAEYLIDWLNYGRLYWKRYAASSRKDPNITKQDVRDFLVAYGKIPEQRAIAACLGTWDRAIETTQRLIEQKQLRKKWLMQNLLTGKKRLPGFDGEWREYAYDDLLVEVKRQVNWDDNELYRLISVRRRSGGLFERENLYGHQILTKTLKTVKKGDFLISKMQIVHGASGLVTKEYENYKVSGSYIVVRSKDEKKLDINYFNWYSKIPEFYHQTYISSYGVHIEKMTFNFNSFLKLRVKIPPLEEQTAIARVLQTADREIELLQAKLEKLKAQKKGLMQQLLTGKKRLNVKEKDKYTN